jgi:putative ABC transport system permease protein
VRIPAVAALVEQREDEADSLGRRVTAGGILAIAGLAAVLLGVAKPAIALVGLGALAVFIALGMLAPLIARPMSDVLGRPLERLLGTAGRLGRENSMRSPRRTAQTAAAMMVGLALVSTISVYGASLSRSATSSVDSAISADYIITGSNGFSQSVAAGAASAPPRRPTRGSSNCVAHSRA